MTPKAKPARREYAPGQWTNLAEEANDGGDGTVEPVVNVYTKLKDQKQCSACALWGRRRFFGDDEWREKSPRCWKCVKAKRAAKDAALYSRAPDIIARNGGVRGRLSWGSESSGLTGSAKTRDVASAQARLKALGVRVDGDDDDDASPPIRVPGLRPGSTSSPSSRSTTPGGKRTYDPNAPIPEVYRSTLYPGLGYRPASRSSPSPKPSPLYRSPAASANLPSPFADRADARDSERRVTGGGGGGFRAPSPSSTLGAYRRDSIDLTSPSARSSFGPLDRGGAPLGTPGKDLVAEPRDVSNFNSDARRSNPNPNPNRRGGGSSPSSRSATESSTFGVPRIFDRFGEKVPSPDGFGAPGARVGTRRCARCGLTGKPTRFSEEEWHAPHAERRCLTCAGESPTTTLARGTRSGAPDYSPSRASEFARADPAAAAAADDDDTDERLGYREYAYGDDDAVDEFRFDRPRPRRRPSATSTTYSVKSQRAEFASDGFGNGPSSPPSPGAGLWYGASSGNPKRAYRALIDACRLREEDAFLYLRESVGRYAAAVAGNAGDRSSAAREHLREFARRADDIGATPEWWTPLHAEMMLQRATDPDDELFVRPVDPTSRATDVATEISRRWGLAGTESLRDLHFAVFPETWEDWGGRRATGEGLDADVPSRHREGDAYDYRVDLSPADRPPRRRTDEREANRRDDFLGGFVATDRDDPEPASRLEPSSSFNPRAGAGSRSGAGSGSGSPRSIGSGSRSPTRSRAPPRASSAARRAAIRAAARTPPPASASRPRPLASPRDPDAGMPVRGDARADLDVDVDDVGEGRIFSAEDLDPSERRAVDVDARADRAARDARAKLLDAGVSDDVACVVSCKSRWGRAGLDLDDWNEADPFTRRVLDALRARGLGCAGARAAGFDDLRLSPASSRRPKAVVLVGVGGAGGDVADMLTNRRWIEELVGYVEDGGVFVAHGEGDEIAEAFSWFGAPWTFGGDYLRASYEFNRECDAVAEWDEWSGAWRDWSSGAAGRYDVKANCLMGVAKRHRAFRPVAAFEDDAETTADAVARGGKRATRAGAGSTGAAEFDLAARLRATGLDPEGTLEACPFAVAQFGHGHVAFVGDVEGTDATVDLIARVATTPRKPTPRYPDDDDEGEDEGEDEGFGGVGGGR